MNQEERKQAVGRFKKSQDVNFPPEAERIFRFYVLFGHKALSNVVEYISRLNQRKLSGLTNTEVDQLLNDIFDNKNGFHAYKMGLVKETVDGVEMDERQNDIVRRLIHFLQAE